MYKLNTSVIDYRSDFTEIPPLKEQNSDTLANTGLTFGAAATDEAYKLGHTKQIGLIEPWFIRLNMRVSNSAVSDSNSHADYSTLANYGMLVIHDKDGTLNTTLDSYDDFVNYSDNSSVYVLAKSLGTMGVNEDATKYICADFNKEIFTYQLDSTIYSVFFMEVEGKYYYSKVYMANLYDLAVDRAAASSGFTVKEQTVYTDMIALYNSVIAYRNDYFSSQ